jgi:hypothetical protein
MGIALPAEPFQEFAHALGSSIAVEGIRLGELRGVLRQSAGGLPAGRTWRARLALLWEEARRRYFVRYHLYIGKREVVRQSGGVVFDEAAAPGGRDPAEYILAEVVKKFHRMRGQGPKCLYRVTSAGWLRHGATASECGAQAEPNAAADRAGIRVRQS